MAMTFPQGMTRTSNLTPSQYERVSSVSSDLKPPSRVVDDDDEDDDDALSRETENGHDPLVVQHGSPSTPLTSVLFGLAGLLNNGPYVIMLACAKSISEGGVAAVYIANVVPGLAVKLTAPYWFDRVPCKIRLCVAAACMGLAFSVTAFFTNEQGQAATSSSTVSHNARGVLAGELLGVALISFQCGLGEASLLALAGKWDREERDSDVESHKTKGQSLTAFSSGTGLAGPMGYLWKIALTEWFGWSVTLTLFAAAVVLSMSYATVCHNLTHDDEVNDEHDFVCSDGDGIFVSKSGSNVEEEGQELVSYNHESTATKSSNYKHNPKSGDENTSFVNDEHLDSSLEVPQIEELSFADRFQLIRTMCWPYMVPLFLVYTAEYACQAGAWTAIGFPVTSEAARSVFYEQSNWLYQFGVFLSRSSGMLFTVNMAGLWAMPLLQVVNLVLFSTTAATGTAPVQGFLYHRPVLLVASFYTGLLGGAVYIHGYKRIVADVPAAYTEFCLASTSVAEGLGIFAADIAGLFLQSCLYKKNGLDGALVECPGG